MCREPPVRVERHMGVFGAQDSQAGKTLDVPAGSTCDGRGNAKRRRQLYPLAGTVPLCVCVRGGCGTRLHGFNDLASSRALRRR